MSSIFAKQALLGDGWAKNTRLTLSEGKIASIAADSAPEAEDTKVDALLPALGNLHSHTFQRAMAGMAEFRSKSRDSFWTWRTLMYRFLEHLTPEQIQAIAALAFMEMQEAGFAAVGEFHYIHHQPGGACYDNLAELSIRIMAAATETGIGLTHLPVLYSYGGIKKAPLSGGQLRFGNDVARFEKLAACAREGARALPEDTRVGFAPHSLRATCPEDLKNALAAHEEGPIHIHAAEQPQEVEQIKAWLNARPVEWLLDQAGVDRGWCLIHATHMTSAETLKLAKSGAAAGLCPITEANLGDGPFNGKAYLAAKGAFGVGTDSNIRISLIEELRTLEYSQRLRGLERNVLVSNTTASVGETLYIGAAEGSAQALQRKAGRIAKGYLADLAAIDSTAPALCALKPDQLLDGLVFAAGNGVITDLWSAGRHMVKQGRHIAREPIVSKYRQAVSLLLAAM